ncbi:MAG: hypothetical protein H6745_12505 [Deltaproteobacteria bacterium]|nr:hypothetical protein [Deltaproteobacteria bacterium]
MKLHRATLIAVSGLLLACGRSAPSEPGLGDGATPPSAAASWSPSAGWATAYRLVAAPPTQDGPLDATWDLTAPIGRTVRAICSDRGRELARLDARITAQSQGARVRMAVTPVAGDPFQVAVACALAAWPEGATPTSPPPATWLPALPDGTSVGVTGDRAAIPAGAALGVMARQVRSPDHWEELGEALPLGGRIVAAETRYGGELGASEGALAMSDTGAIADAQRVFGEDAPGPLVRLLVGTVSPCGETSGAAEDACAAALGGRCEEDAGAWRCVAAAGARCAGYGGEIPCARGLTCAADATTGRRVCVTPTP